MTIYKLIWDDFCSWYLEMIKPGYGERIDLETYNQTLILLKKCLIILHPFMPFISEEIWSGIKNKKDDPIIISEWPTSKKIDDSILESFDHISQLITNVRKYRNENGISYKEKLELFSEVNQNSKMKSVILKLANSDLSEDFSRKSENAHSIIVGSNEYFINNLSNQEEDLDKVQGDLDYNLGFLKSIQTKLSNKRFVDNAPDVVITNERKKEKDTLKKIKMLELKLKK